MWKGFARHAALLPLIGVVAFSAFSSAQGLRDDDDGMVPLPVASKIQQLRSFDGDPSKSVEFQDQGEFIQPGFGKVRVKDNTDLIYHTNVGEDKTTAKVGVSQGLYRDQRHQVRASVYGTTEFAPQPSEEGAALGTENVGVGGGAGHSYRVTPTTEFQSAVTYEDDLNGKSHRLTGRLQVEQKLSDRSMVSFGTSQQMNETGDLDHQIGARISVLFGPKPKSKKKEKNRNPHYWYEILVTKQKLDEGGLALGEDVELYSTLVDNLLGFADQLEIAQGVDPRYLGEMMERNNTAGYPLGVALDSRQAMACRYDMVHAARTSALYYYELLKKRFPAHPKTRRLSYNEPMFDAIHRRGLSIHKKCVAQGGPAVTPGSSHGSAPGTQ